MEWSLTEVMRAVTEEATVAMGGRWAGGERTAVVMATTAVMKVMLPTRVQWR